MDLVVNHTSDEHPWFIESRKGKDGNEVVKHLFTGSPWGCDVWLYEVIGGSHTWHTVDIDTGEEVWKFFSKYVN